MCSGMLVLGVIYSLIVGYMLLGLVVVRLSLVVGLLVIGVVLGVIVV